MSSQIEAKKPTGAPASLLEPKRPHDALSFDDLASRYNFQLTSNNRLPFTRLVIDECRARPRPIRVLDVGCGRGIGRRIEYTWAIREHCDELWGIEPDPGVKPDEGLFDRLECALMEDADVPENYFDVAYAYMVAEHVVNPKAFLSAIARCLRPGGVFISMTPCGRHYFTRTAKLLHTLKLDEGVLRIIRRGTVDDYHYPVAYRMNTERAVTDAAKASGFAEPKYAYLEGLGTKGYMKGPLVLAYHALSLKRKLIKDPTCLATMTMRMEAAGKPEETQDSALEVNVIPRKAPATAETT